MISRTARKVLLVILAITLVFTSQSWSAYTVSAASGASEYGLIQELAKSDYTGRQAGTPGYAKAVSLIESRMKAIGMSPMLEGGKFRQSVPTAVAVLTKEQVSINGKSLALMKDYMPYARSAEGKYTFTGVYDAAAGNASDYKGKVDGLVLFRWLDKDGKFPQGLLDRIQRAVAQGAKGVLVITNGELKVGNYEHPLNGHSISVPVLYISEEAARQAGFKSDYLPVQLPTPKVEMQLTISRTSSSADNLIGVIPGKQEKAVLWVTNIDGFGSLPDGRWYESAISGSAATTMMLDMARYYGEHQPEYTQIFTFVGSKWTGQEGITALANKLNFESIAATVDLYAMGGSADIRIGYTDPSFESFAKASFNQAYYNNDLGNALSNTLRGKTKRLLIVRDQNTWVDDSMADKASAITKAQYESGVKVLLEQGDRMMSQLSKEDSVSFDYEAQAFTPAAFDNPKLTLSRIESKHYTIYADEVYRGQITPSIMKEMDAIYERDAYYNYRSKTGPKIIALFMQDGNKAAVIAGRTDLEGQSEAAGGGFANFNRKDNQIYIYMRSGPYMETIAHESNHALASSNPHSRDQSVLEEWQGQSHFVRYANLKYLEDPAALINSRFANNHEVPDLMRIIANYKTALDWTWFTKLAPNPNGHLYTYYTMGSMYAFLNYKYGEATSRRAIYRNYQDVTRAQQNLIADTGLSLDAFLQAWSSWMARPDAALVSTGSNNEFDYMMLYTLPDPKDGSPASGGNGNTGNAGNAGNNGNIGQALPGTNMKAGSKGNIDFSYQFASKDLSIVSVKLSPTKTGAQFVIIYKSTDSRYVNIFNPPNGDRLLKFQDKVAKPIKGQATFTFTQKEVTTLLGVGLVAFKFGNKNDFLFVRSSDIANLLKKKV
ncbi:hypothetical protein [Cohnella abietis]|uniref:Peptidase M28 domain-containing protein n=1 Tax=Cohnella abietis TaxID=2507935 RepID=A0A3T1CYB4_9BACL|nr:hypothetical protein [Cohnella abietis]BBI30824.1 hypothetical protein KCTCHS21_02230 [Cohnella abietis]